MRAHHGVERDLLAVPEAVVLQPGRVPALAGVVVVADVGVGAGEHHLINMYVYCECDVWCWAEVSQIKIINNHSLSF